FEARFTRLLRAAPERSSPQADTAEFAASRSRFFAGIPVPIRHQTAMLATKHPLRQVQFGFHRTAARTGLARGKPPIRHHRRAIKAGLVVKLAAQCGLRRFATRLVLWLPFGQGPVVGEPRRAAAPPQNRRAAYWLDQARFYEPASLRRFLNS